MLPLISVIIPVYNSELYLSTCLESIVSQTYKNLQILLIDDGSTDRSPLICDEYRENDSRITVIHKENQGVSSARNLGISRASGDYISFVDSDDWLDLEAYEHLISCVVEHHVDAVIFEYVVNYPDGIKVHQTYPELSGVMDKETAIKTTISPINRFAWSKIYAKKLVDDIRFEKDIHIGEDTLFACLALNKANSVLYVAKPFYHYLQSEISATRCSFNAKRFTGVEAYWRLVDFCMTSHPPIVGTALASYINLIIATVTDLHANQDFPDARKHVRYLVHEVRKHCFRILFSSQSTLRLRVKLVVFIISPWLSFLIHKQRHGKTL